MVQFLSIIFFLGFLKFLLGFSKVPGFLCQSVFAPQPYGGIDHAGPQRNIDNCNSQAGSQIPVEFRTCYFLT